MAQYDSLFTRFLAVSLIVHGCVFAYFALISRSMRIPPAPPAIPVSMIEPSGRAASTAPPEAAGTAPAPSRTPRTAAKVAQRDAPAITEPGKDQKARIGARGKRRSEALAQKTRLDKTPPVESSPEVQTTAVSPVSVPQRETLPEKTILAERQLPSAKDLLPSATGLGSGRGNAPISLNTKDPTYVTYFNRIKIAINRNWEYPELALHYGLQGKLSIELLIGSNGQLDQLRITRSSGSELLDGEALRAVKAAAPFPPIPNWIKEIPLLISATMEYHDNRVNTR